MTLSPDFVLGLDDEPERLRAVAYLAERANGYPPGLFVPPLQQKTGEEREVSWAAVAVHVEPWGDDGADRIASVEVDFSGDMIRDFPPDDEDCAAWFARYIFPSKRAGTLYVLNGGRIGILDTFIQTVGPHLIELGYRIEPAPGGGGIGWMKVKRAKRTWTLTTVEMLTGNPLATLLDFATSVRELPDGSSGPTAELTSAIGAYASLIRREFGTALRPTVGMIASSSARRFLPEDALKWRPSPLLIAFERDGRGYRGGVAFGTKFRGDVHRIDVNRQYTALLRGELPCGAVFTKWGGPTDTRIGVYMCTIETDTPLVYPLGSWDDSAREFSYGGVERGRTVCVLHTSEFPGLYAQGVRIEPGLGFAYSSMFTLAPYVDRLEEVTARFGRGSAGGSLMKPLGNLVYGKFGQKPKREQLCFSLERPDDSWSPYVNDNLEDIAGVWERFETRHTSGSHVDIASHITAAARSQLLETWALLEHYGYHIVTAHTDSITTTSDPRAVLETDAETFGAWKYEGSWIDGVFIGAGRYALDDTGHIAGVSHPERSVLEELHANGIAMVSRMQNTPRQGWTRGTAMVTKRLTG